MGKMIGYARSEPGPGAQATVIDQEAELRRAGCAHVFSDVANSYPNDGPSLLAALDELRPGDCFVACTPALVTECYPQWLMVEDAAQSRQSAIRTLSPAAGTEDPEERYLLRTRIIYADWQASRVHGPHAPLKPLVLDPVQWPPLEDVIAELRRRRDEASALFAAGVEGISDELAAAAIAGFDRRIAELLADAEGRAQ